MTQIKTASTIQELKKRADVDQPTESGGEVDVYKFRSIFSQENFYTFHRILESEKLDLFLLTETWHTQSTPTTLLNRNYNILLCNNDERRGDGVNTMCRFLSWGRKFGKKLLSQVVAFHDLYCFVVIIRLSFNKRN